MSYDPVSDRIKGLFPAVLENVEDIENFLRRQASSNRQHPASRLSVRVFTGPGITEAELTTIEVEYRGATIRLEAFFKIDLEDLGGLAYFGGNAPERGVSPSWEIEAEYATWRSVRARPIEHKPLLEGYLIEILQNPTPIDIADLLDVYRDAYKDYPTPFNTGSLESMCRNNVVVVARKRDGHIVAVSQGEIADLREINISLVELTETASLSSHKGLSTHIKKRLIDELKGPRVIIYAETRCAWGAVQRSNYVAGMHVFGRLERHCRISSYRQDFQPSHRYLGDLFVFVYDERFLQAA